MIEFNGRGYIIPYLNVPSTIEEFENVFVKAINSTQRVYLFDCYRQYLADLKQIIGEGHIQWIDGGFTTRKPNPEDVDLVTFIDFKIVDQHTQALRGFIYPKSYDDYRMDAYIIKVYPAKHRYIAQYLGDKAYWFDQFDSTEPNRRGNFYPKGFLEVQI